MLWYGSHAQAHDEDGKIMGILKVFDQFKKSVDVL